MQPPSLRRMAAEEETALPLSAASGSGRDGGTSARSWASPTTSRKRLRLTGDASEEGGLPALKLLKGISDYLSLSQAASGAGHLVRGGPRPGPPGRGPQVLPTRGRGSAARGTSSRRRQGARAFAVDFLHSGRFGRGCRCLSAPRRARGQRALDGRRMRSRSGAFEEGERGCGLRRGTLELIVQTFSTTGTPPPCIASRGANGTIRHTRLQTR